MKKFIRIAEIFERKLLAIEPEENEADKLVKDCRLLRQHLNNLKSLADDDALRAQVVVH